MERRKKTYEFIYKLIIMYWLELFLFVMIIYDTSSTDMLMVYKVVEMRVGD